MSEDPANAVRLQQLERLRDNWLGNRSSRQFLQVAEEFRRLGRPGVAAELLEMGLEAHPRYLSAQVALARCKMELGMPADAVGLLERVVDLDGTHPLATRLLVEAYLSVGSLPAAGEKLSLYKLLNPGDPLIERLSEELRAARRAAIAPSPAQASSVVAAASSVVAGGGEAEGSLEVLPVPAAAEAIAAVVEVPSAAQPANLSSAATIVLPAPFAVRAPFQAAVDLPAFTRLERLAAPFVLGRATQLPLPSIGGPLGAPFSLSTAEAAEEPATSQEARSVAEPPSVVVGQQAAAFPDVMVAPISEELPAGLDGAAPQLEVEAPVEVTQPEAAFFQPVAEPDLAFSESTPFEARYDVPEAEDRAVVFESEFSREIPLTAEEVPTQGMPVFFAAPLDVERAESQAPEAVGAAMEDAPAPSDWTEAVTATSPGAAESASLEGHLPWPGEEVVVADSLVVGERVAADGLAQDSSAPGAVVAAGTDAAASSTVPEAVWARPSVLEATDAGQSQVSAVSLPSETTTLGLLYLRQGHAIEAERIFRRVLAREPSNEAARDGLRRAMIEVDLERGGSGRPAGVTARKIQRITGWARRLRRA